MKVLPAHPRFSRSLSVALIALAWPVLAWAGPANPGKAATEERVTFANSLAPLPKIAGAKTATLSSLVASSATALSAAQLAEPMDLNVSLAMRDFTEFQTRVSNGETVPFAEMEARYLPLPADYAALRVWLVDQGFAVTRDDERRLGIFITGTPVQVQASFGVKMQSVTVDGATTAAAVTAPSLPASISKGVLGIVGLQPYLKARRHIQMHAAAGLDGPAPQTTQPHQYLVPEIRKAYDAASLVVGSTTLTGANQKIAILIDVAPATTDLTTFWTQNSVSQTLSNYETTPVVTTGTLDSAGGEETLDAEWSSGTAPGSKVRLYLSRNLNFTSINACLSQIATDVSGTSPSQPQLHQLSLSLGIGETYLGVGSSIFTTEAQYFTTITNGSTTYGGVTVFVSSGDAGSTPDSTGHANGGPLQAEYESTDPSVTGVGGTALDLNTSTGLRNTEVVWNDPAAGSYYSAGATGGGTSIQFARPSWQVGTGVPAGAQRLAPDVALVAAGSTPGILIFQGGSYYIAGTSWSSPTWAGFMALINQGRAVNGRLPAGFLNPRIYPLIGTNNFTDITSGNNAGGTSAGGNYAANAGYDECTGVGVPDVAKLLATLLGPTVTGFTPGNAVVGTSVVITGTNFYTSATLPLTVTFNGTAATSVTVNSATQITVVVPSGATAGPIGVKSLGDATASSTSFGSTPSFQVAQSSTPSAFNQGDNGDSYTVNVSNTGIQSSSGVITATITAGTGLHLVAGSGSGWNCLVSGSTCVCTRSDALASGASYPAITITVNVSPTSASTVSFTSVVGSYSANSSTPVNAVADTPTRDWRYQYFGTTANTGNAADTANPTGDGISNLLKYALGLNPTVPTANPETEDTSSGYLQLTVPKNPNATDITYTVQVNGDLTNPGGWTAIGTTIMQNTASLLQVRDNTPVSGTPKRFIRLQTIR